jgi:hypothetical protein
MTKPSVNAWLFSQPSANFRSQLIIPVPNLIEQVIIVSENSPLCANSRVRALRWAENSLSFLRSSAKRDRGGADALAVVREAVMGFQR